MDPLYRPVEQQLLELLALDILVVVHGGEQPTRAREGGTMHTIYVNKERTVMVRVFDGDYVEVALRESPDHIWGPPVRVTKELAGTRVDEDIFERP